MAVKKYLPMRGEFVHRICPAPKRFLQRFILEKGLKTGLDIGCGVASPLTALHAHGFHSTGIDIDQGEIEKSRAAKAHSDYICGDFRTMDLGKKFDVVVLSHLIEHFDRDAGMEVMRRVEKLAARLVYIETPLGFIEQTAFDGNAFQRHLSGWFPEDFEARGYTVFGGGLHWLRESGSQPSSVPEWLKKGLTRALQWHVFRHPKRAAAIAGMRFVDENGDLRQI